MTERQRRPVRPARQLYINYRLIAAQRNSFRWFLSCWSGGWRQAHLRQPWGEERFKEPKELYPQKPLSPRSATAAGGSGEEEHACPCTPHQPGLMSTAFLAQSQTKAD
ncbi:hypothetical protein MHYP_G00255100 [Metynnis hypsauchen]